jgi:hypothetical protein
MGYGYYLGNVFIKRKKVTDSYVMHYTTKIVQKSSNGIIALDGWSSIDYRYIYEAKPRGELFFRNPRNANSIILYKDRDNVIIPRMSYDILSSDEDFYLKPIARKMGFRSVDDLLSSAVIYDQYGYLGRPEDVPPAYFPYIRELSYDKPDLTITLYTYDGGIHKSVIDVYGIYYFNVFLYDHPFYRRQRQLLFMGYLIDIWGIIPPITVSHVEIDPWRRYTKPIDFNGSDWVKLTDSEWCGSYSQSELALKNLEDVLLKLLEIGVFESVATVISYSSNVFVTYIDFYVKKKDPATYNIYEEKIKRIVEEIQHLETREIIENILNL